MSKFTLRLYAFCAFALMATAVPAQAQFQRRSVSDPATGERYHIEFGAGFWAPSADMAIRSESLGIAGTTINFKNDLGLTDNKFGQIEAVLRPGRKHRLRFEYIPIKYNRLNQTVLLDENAGDSCRGIVFNGQCYQVGVPVNWDIKWNAFRFGYEYDFIYRDRGFGGFILETKYTDVQAQIGLTSCTAGATTCTEFAHARGPIPAIGGIARVYVMPNISITGELSGIDIPKIQDKYKAHYADFDMYGTLNLINNAGLQIGYRSLDVGYLFKSDSGDFTIRGLYFGVVARY